MRRDQLIRDVAIVKVLLICTIIVLTVYYCTNIVMPIIFSGLIAILLTPWFKKMTKWGIPPAISAFIAVFTVTSIFAGMVFLVLFESQQIISSLPEKEVKELSEMPTRVIESQTNLRMSDYAKDVEHYSEKIKNFLISSLPETILRITDVFIFFVTCPIYIFFMLLYRNNLKAFYYSCMRVKHRKEGTQLLHQIQEAYSNYLKGLVLVMIIISVLTGTGLFFMGIRHPIFLGVLSGILVLIPYIGVIASAILPILMALLFKDSIWYTVGVIGLFAAIQFFEGNIITPKIMGNQVDVNPLMVIFGLIIFGAIGGILGMIITIPLLALIKITASYKPNWKPLELLLKVK